MNNQLTAYIRYAESITMRKQGLRDGIAICYPEQRKEDERQAMSTIARLLRAVGMVLVVLQLTACGSGFTDILAGGIGGTGIGRSLINSESAVIRLGENTVRYWSKRAA
jgi:hypothetical protein